MLLKHFIFYIILNISLNFNGVYGENIVKPSTGLKILKNVVKLTDTLLEPYINISIAIAPPNCVQMLCKFVCFNGKSSEITKDIDLVSERNNLPCSIVEELRLYNYEFPDNKLSNGFLGNYTNKVLTLYLASSNITDIETGAFANGIFVKINFENLKLSELKKEFFKDISTNFQSLSVIQKEEPLQTVDSNFLTYVKYQIKYLTMQVGLSCVHNLTGGDSLLNNLIYVDFSFNNFLNRLAETTFNKLSMVEHIDLSHSNIEYIPAYIFADFTTTLEYLDLSFNKLKTISRTIFGWREIPRDLKIYADENEWICTCDLQKELKEIFIYQTTTLVCSEPQEYLSWSVFDDRICGEEKTTTPKLLMRPTTPVSDNNDYGDDDEDDPGHQKPFSPPDTDETTDSVLTTSFHYTSKPQDDLINLECSSDSGHHGNNKLYTNWPLLDFTLKPLDNLRVMIVIDTSTKLNDSYSLIWFSKVTTEYYKMEINYNEYGLGCYGAISYVTTVIDLVPNTAYTFCVLLKQQMRTSPFSCKSIHIGSNLSIQYSAWLTRDMRVTGLSLIIFGIVMFSFAGILMIYLLLKHKPILLKGSKRITTTHGNNGDIVVLPKEKSAQTFKEKEEKLASRSPFSCTQRRRNSSESIASYQSYMNANLYEIIPAHNKINSTSAAYSNPHLQIPNTDADNSDMDCSYLTPLNIVSSTVDLVNYAEIPYRAKRISNDPLPEVPADQAPLSLALSENVDKSEYTDVGVIYMLDSQV